MTTYLDSNIVIYLVEQTPKWFTKVSSRLAELQSAGEKFAASDLTRLECLVGPHTLGDTKLQDDFQKFFSASGVSVIGFSPAVFDRATGLRATWGFKTPDALHLSVAIENHCDRFLTNDFRLSRCPGILVEIVT